MSDKNSFLALVVHKVRHFKAVTSRGLSTGLIVIWPGFLVGKEEKGEPHIFSLLLILRVKQEAG